MLKQLTPFYEPWTGTYVTLVSLRVSRTDIDPAWRTDALLQRAIQCTNRVSRRNGILKMNWMGVVAIILGILVLVLPDLIRWFVGVGLIVLGVLALARR